MPGWGARAAVLLLSALLAVPLAGCGSDSGSGADRAGGRGAGSAGAFPVSVAGKFGTATIPAAPRRVVAMSWTDADFALALGSTPVGMSKDPTAADGGIQPWTRARLDGTTPTLFVNQTGDPVEKIAALHPDLILATRDYHLDESYRTLSKLAPVVSYPTAPNYDTWQAAFARSAKALGRSAEARRIIAATEAKVTATGRAHRELAGATYTYAISPTSSSVYTTNSEQDVSVRLLDGLGLRLAPAVTKLKTSEIPGRAEISLEQAAVLDADVLIVAGPPAAARQFTDNPIVRRLSVARRGAVVPLPFTRAVALAFPSPVSIDWAMDNVVPDLAAAARKK